MGSKLLTWCERHVHGAGSRPRAESARLEQVTVVIPSYGRQDFLLRQLSYWSDRKARVVIVDGSPRPFDVDTLRLVAALPSITYVHAAGTIGQRLKIAADLVETPYAVLSGDDEFLLTRGLARAIDKLDAQSDLVACIGQSIGFYPSNDGRSTTYAAGYPHWRYEVLQDTARAAGPRDGHLQRSDVLRGDPPTGMGTVVGRDPAVVVALRDRTATGHRGLLRRKALDRRRRVLDALIREPAGAHEGGIEFETHVHRLVDVASVCGRTRAVC